MLSVKKIIISFILLLMMSESGFANYKAASQYYQRRDYVSAAAFYFQAYTGSGQQVRRQAEWYLADCLLKLGFYYSASKYYTQIVRRGPRRNPFFRQALEALGKVNSKVTLGQSHIVKLFKVKIPSSYVPGSARGFYFYYLGMAAFNKKKYEKAANYFRKVNSGSKYYLKAVFHSAVIANMRGNHSRSINLFKKVGSSARGLNSAWLKEQANLNIARVNYEVKRYRQSINYYSRIPRDSDNWLEALFEASWALFILQKHNNVLGTIHTLHSPFFINRFYPESYILQAITFLRLCRFKKVKGSLLQFKKRYKGTFNQLKGLLSSYRNNKSGFFKLVYKYRVGSLRKYKSVWAILDSLSRADSYYDAGTTIRFTDKEINRLSRFRLKWSSTGLIGELKSFLRSKKKLAVSDSGQRLYRQLRDKLAHLKDLSDQTNLINAEMLLKRVAKMRSQLKLSNEDKKAVFIGGLQSLNITQDLEYWPFSGEYWEDELGGYVYNIGSKCNKSSKKRK